MEEEDVLYSPFHVEAKIHFDPHSGEP